MSAVNEPYPFAQVMIDSRCCISAESDNLGITTLTFPYRIALEQLHRACTLALKDANMDPEELKRLNDACLAQGTRP